MKYLSIVALVLNLCSLSLAALTSQWNGVPLSACRRSCLQKFYTCNEYNRIECQFLAICTRNCYKYHQENHQQRRSGADENKKSEQRKKGCLGDCQGLRDMCGIVSNNIYGVYQCNQANRLCRMGC